jgi:hypothetical protein
MIGINGFLSLVLHTILHHSVTKFTPYELLYGRIAKIPRILQQKPQLLYNYENLVHDFRQKLQVAWQQAKERLQVNKAKQCEKVNKNRNCKQYVVGDLVLVYNEQRNKLDSLWNGPYEVKEINGMNVTLSKLGTTGKKQIKTHVNRTKPYVTGSVET